MRYFFGNTLASFFRSSTSVVESTTAGRFDSDFVANAIAVPGSAYIDSMPFIDAPSATTLWLHFEIYAGSGSTHTGRWVRFYNLAGAEVAYIGNGSASTNVQLWVWDGAAFQNVSGSFAKPTGAARTRWDVKLVCGAAGSFAIYNAGAPVVSGNLAYAAFDNIAKVRFEDMTDGSTTYYSQVLGTDEDTRDHRYMQGLANANGFYADGTGGFGDINEAVLDEGTAIGLPAVGNKKSFTKPAIVVPAGYKIAAACVAGRGRVGGVPVDAKFLIRSDGLDALSTAKLFNGGYEPRGHCLEIDPATAAQFVEAGYNAAEFGAEAV